MKIEELNKLNKLMDDAIKCAKKETDSHEEASAVIRTLTSFASLHKSTSDRLILMMGNMIELLHGIFKDLDEEERKSLYDHFFLYSMLKTLKKEPTKAMVTEAYEDEKWMMGRIGYLTLEFDNPAIFIPDKNGYLHMTWGKQCWWGHYKGKKKVGELDEEAFKIAKEETFKSKSTLQGMIDDLQ